MGFKSSLSALSQVFSFLAPTSEQTQKIAEIESRYESLRAWRNALAKERERPPFTILSNRTLLEVATKNPQTREALLEVRGIGDKKLEQFGEAVLRSLSQAKPA
jgi:ATP-dependent DNA helicase RecQ